MPCDSIQLSQVEFLPTSTDLGMLKAALEGLGFNVNENKQGLSFTRYGCYGQYDQKTGRLDMRGQTLPDTNEIKKGYSKQVVTSQAKKMGWAISWTKNEKGEEEAIVMRR